MFFHQVERINIYISQFLSFKNRYISKKYVFFTKSWTLLRNTYVGIRGFLALLYNIVHHCKATGNDKRQRC
jgi:hypothetical protein